MSNTNNTLKINHLSKKFGKTIVLQDVSLSVSQGSTYALLGPNGSGKTTLLKSLMGSIFYDTGSVYFNGKVNTNATDYKKDITYMPQIPGLLPNLSPKESIGLLINLRQKEPVFKQQLIDDLGIKTFWNRPFSKLSGGMKQKINILQCFMFESNIIFLDEPTSSLDPQVASYVKKWIKKLKENNKTILFTSHIMSEVEDIADKMALLNDGKILFEVSPKEFTKKYQAKNLEEAMVKYWSSDVT
ncbi:MAG: ABC transporter ATP-binding protein [Bdellovibrionales bacterium]|nr:ABC transporter ATP-binding protein [Bdellovibrionales bacterium]